VSIPPHRDYPQRLLEALKNQLGIAAAKRAYKLDDLQSPRFRPAFHTVEIAGAALALVHVSSDILANSPHCFV